MIKAIEVSLCFEKVHNIREAFIEWEMYDITSVIPLLLFSAPCIHIFIHLSAASPVQDHLYINIGNM